jgi:hypothetical protein
MKFVLVNHRIPHKSSACTTCSRSLEHGFLHDLSTRKQYCGVECYHLARSVNDAFACCLIAPLALALAWPQFVADTMSALLNSTPRDPPR